MSLNDSDEAAKSCISSAEIHAPAPGAQLHAGADVAALAGPALPSFRAKLRVARLGGGAATRLSIDTLGGRSARLAKTESRMASW